jgi:hypothetical protein
VIAWGKVQIRVDPSFEPSSILQNPWEARSAITDEGHSSILTLITSYGGKPQFVWEQQRGYLELCVGRPFVCYIKSLGHKIDCTPPNEKYYRLGVSKDKSKSIAYAAAYFANTSPKLVQDLTSRPVSDMHDVADACLLAIMWLEEHSHLPILNSQFYQVPSGCPVSETLAFMYRAANVNGRKGSNITRSIAVTARIAASTAKFLTSFPAIFAPIRLTRQFLRNLGMPRSEAADLCCFASSVINSLYAPFVGVAFDLGGLCFSFYKVKGNKRCAAAALDDTDAFKSIMVY